MEYNEWYMTGVCGRGMMAGMWAESGGGGVLVGGEWRRCMVCGVGKSYVGELGMPRKAGANALWHLADKWLESIG